MPTRGTTRQPIRYGCMANFNPRAHEGHDALKELFPDMQIISIHVPTRGTTRQMKQTLLSLPISIHVPTRGTTWISTSQSRSWRISIHVPTRGTTTAYIIIRYRPTFQSTCPRGARRTICNRYWIYIDFNPRAHEGHDVVMLRGLGVLKYFNPRAHEGHDGITNQS